MKPKTLWIARDSQPHTLSLNVSNRKMTASVDGYFEFPVDAFCDSHFQELTGVYLKPGEQARFRLVRLR